MKKIICLIAMAVTLIGIPCFAAHGKNPEDIPSRKQVPMHTPIGHSLDRPIHMQRHPLAVLPPHIEINRPLPLPPIRPYYSYYSYYYPTITTVTPITSVTADVNRVVVSVPYAEINTTANVINAAANVATMIRFWSW